LAAAFPCGGFFLKHFQQKYGAALRKIMRKNKQIEKFWHYAEPELLYESHSAESGPRDSAHYHFSGHYARSHQKRNNVTLHR
jgi:hypothetical protein